MLISIKTDDLENPFKSKIKKLKKQIHEKTLTTDQEVREVFILTAILLIVIFKIRNFTSYISKYKRNETD